MSTPTNARDVRTMAITIGVCVTGVILAATVQHLVVLGVPVSPIRYVVPTMVGLSLGTLLGHVLNQRRALRASQSALDGLNAELERRVEQRTAELEEKTKALFASQRVETVGRVAGGLAHDVNNLLTVLMGSSEALHDLTRDLATDTGRRKAEHALADFDAAVESIAGLTTQMLALSRADHARLEPVDLAEILSRSTPVLRRIAGSAVRVVVQSPPAPCMVSGNRVQLGQVLLNLVVNARDAMPNGGEVRVALSSNHQNAHLEVVDTGVGMDELTRARALEPLFTTKPLGKGTGLGLAVVNEVVQRSGGTVEVTSSLGKGSTFLIALPLVHRPTASPPPV